MRRFLDWTAAQHAATGANNQSASSSQPNRGTHFLNQLKQQSSPSSAHQQLQQQTHSQYSTPGGTIKDLEIQHLLKLLHEIKYCQASSSPLPSAMNSQVQRDFVDKIHKTVPLFLNVFGSNTIQTVGAATSSSSFILPETGHSVLGSNAYCGGRSTSQSSLSTDEVREWSQCDSCSSSKPSSPLPPRSPPMDKYPDILPFSFTIARLFVSEVRQRASDKHAEDASLAILQFLNAKHIQRTFGTDKSTDLLNQKSTSDQASLDSTGLGWDLLLALNTLANSQNPQIINLLCEASLPSTLIKCLYLFYDLPVNIRHRNASSDQQLDLATDKSGDKQEISIDSCNARGLISVYLIRAFTQLLIQLCSFQSAIDELIRKDDLRLVLGIASSQCPTQNKFWRKTAFHALTAISKAMRDNFIYLEQNLCIQVYVDNLNRTNSLGFAGIEDLIEMIRVLIEFVYNLDVNNRNQRRKIAPIIEQLKTSHLIELMEEILFKIDDLLSQESSSNQVCSDQDLTNCSMSQQPSVSSEVGVCIDDYRRFAKRLILTFITMSKIYYNQDAMSKNATLKPLAMNRFEMLEQFKMPKPSARDCILNNDILRIFKLIWSRCKDNHIIESILDATISLFNDDKYNYFVFESEQLLVYYMSSPNFNQFPCKLRQKLFKFLEFIVIETNYIPCLELGTLGAILTSKETVDFDRALVLKTLISCLRFSSKFSDIFRDIGILEVIINLLNEAMQKEDLSQSSENLEILCLLLESSQYLLAGSNNLNCIQFNESGAARHVFNCLSKPKFFHIFVPPHSSSSDDGGGGLTSRNSTPTPTGVGKASGHRHLIPMIQANHNLLDHDIGRMQTRPSMKQMQKVAFSIIRQLILSNVGDEHLANLLGLLARNTDDLRNIEIQDLQKEEGSKQNRLDFAFLISQEVNLKIYILKSLMIILKDNHRCRTLFRKVGGFIYIVSALETLEKALPLCDRSNELDLEIHNRWRIVNGRRIWRLVKNTLMTIVVAIRSEPLNLRVFCDETLPKLTAAIKNLGCFRTDSSSFQKLVKAPPRSGSFNSYKSIFLSPPARDLSTIADDNVNPTEACCQILRFLYDMSLDMADGTAELDCLLDEESGKIFHSNHMHRNHESKSLSFDQSSVEPATALYKRRSHLQNTVARPPSLDLKNCTTEPAILTFPNIIMSMLDLIPSSPDEELMIFACMIIKSLFKHERNQQMLCGSGMIEKLLNPEWSVTLTNREHILHSLTEYMFEKLTKQAISPRELKKFLRLGDPLCCRNLDDIEVGDQTSSNSNGHESIRVKPLEKISTYRIDTLVNMMTNEHDECQPPFVEFDLNGCSSSYIFMPSIAPINAKTLPQNSSYFLNSTLEVHTTEKNGILGGVGPTERLFPPASGLTFSSWICVEQFPSRSTDPSHNIRLLTIYRGSAASGKEYSCLRVQISALDRALTLSTQEALLFETESRPDSQPDPDCFVRVWTPEALFEGRWHHIVVCLSKGGSKQSGVHIFIDGQLIHNQRINYISNNVGPSNAGPLGSGGPSNGGSPAAFVNAFIGSLPQIRVQTRTRWKQGPCHLIEDSLSSSFVNAVYSLGPNHIGNFQSVYRNDSSKSRQNKQGQTGTSHGMGHLTHQSASFAHVSPRHAFPLSRVSSSGLSQSQSSNFTSQQNGSHASNIPSCQISEDKILIGLDARSTSFMSLTRMRKIYTRFDCRQVTRFLRLSAQESSTSLLLLHNTAVHLNGPSRGVGALTIGHDQVRSFIPYPTERTLFHIGGSYVLFAFVAQSQSQEALYTSIRALVNALIGNPKLQAQMEDINGFQMLTMMFWKKQQFLNQDILNMLFSLVTCDYKNLTRPDLKSQTKAILQVAALRELICECFDLWLQANMINPVLEFIYNLICSPQADSQTNSNNSNEIRSKNLKCVREMDLLPRMLRLLPRDPAALTNEESVDENEQVQSTPQSSSQTFDAKAIYLIKQTVFELLNRTPRLSDLLYFGQFLISLLPTSDKEERSDQTVNLRNVLLKSLLQMMTRNKQSEVNHAIQGELVRILGFDWFMLFINGSHINQETITLGFLNLMIVLSNDELYSCFKGKSNSNGGWLREPTFSTIDGRFNIQLLGINVGVFFGLSHKNRAVCQEVLEAPNFCLLGNCLSHLKTMPHIYLMIFQTMMGRLAQLDASVLDTISSFEKLSLDSLCDCLIGETHHKRRQTLAEINFRSLEFVVSLTYMIRDIMCQFKAETNDDQAEEITERDSGKIDKKYHNIPTDIVRFFMYLYNNNSDFQSYCCRSEDLIDALSETLMVCDKKLSKTAIKQVDNECVGEQCNMTKHPAAKEILELSRLMILDRMTETTTTESTEFGTYDQLQTFERFLDALSTCREAQGELVDMLLRQILLLIDSTSRHNSTKTINGSDNMHQFRLLLINSILVSQIVIDKIWLQEIFCDNNSQISNMIDHQLCLAEQIFKLNEILPKSNPPHAFTMQHTLNRAILYALSRPTQTVPEKMFMLELLKKIYDNRTIIILNHMHSQQSAEFFVCFTYCLLKIIEENAITPSKRSSGGEHQQPDVADQPSSLIERQYGNPSGNNAVQCQRSISINDPSNNSALMLVSLARKVWDAIYQSKRGILSEAFDVPLSLPAFTLDTSLDLVQLRPDINSICEKYWSNLITSEQKSRRRLQVKQNDASQNTTSAAVNILSGRLTRVVNAASFVSRVVGATAGTMASNVNLVGERLAQTTRTNMKPQRSPSDLSPNSIISRTTTATDPANSGQATVSPFTANNGQQQQHLRKSNSNQSLACFKHSALTKLQITDALRTHVNIIDDFIKSQFSQKNHKHALHKYLYDEWLDIEFEMLLRERAIFGPESGSILEKWCLDLTEGPRRMRKKMVNNTRQFYENYPYSPEQFNPGNKSLRYRPPMSFDSYLYYLKTLNLDKQLLVVVASTNDEMMQEKSTERLGSESAIDRAELQEEFDENVPDGKVASTVLVSSPASSPTKKKPHEFHSSSLESISSALRLQSGSPKLAGDQDYDQDDGDSTSFVDFSPEIEAETNSARESENTDSLSVLRLLEKNERISHMFRCSRVQGLDTYEGLMLFGREHFYLIDGFTLLKTREIKDIDSLPPDAHDPIIPNSTPNILAHSKKTCAKFSYDSVMEVHKRRYLLQPIALEIFSSDGRNALIVFPRNIRNKVHSRLMAVATQITSNAQDSLAGQKSNVSVEGGSGLLSNLMGETSVTQRWVRGELSNFQYLMNLNTIAGRSYNDLMQYPIFPWVLSDYTSDYLDLSKPSTFRNLARPIGGQTSERLEQFKRRYSEWDDTETPPYHYGTFYSSAMIVASYMVRMEPFTQHFLRLQGGHFDLADRMFHSINDSWLSASKHNMADIRELIPEFFYLPEFLMNSNKYDLGIKQNGMRLDDVILPPWAKNDAREFIRLHRCALESDYVSAHLHEWIDLIFGCKQQGQAAVDAVNVFHHLFYEGNVDIYNTDIDPIKKNAIIGFINNFGQVPKQLFKKPHPARKVSYGGNLASSSPMPLTPMLPSLSTNTNISAGQRVLTHCPQMLRQLTSTIKDLRGPVGQIVQVDRNIVAVEQNKLLIPPEYCRYIAWGHADRSLRMGLYESEKPIFVWEGSENLGPYEILCCTIPNNRVMITAGTDSLLTVWKIDKMRSFSPMTNLYGHVEPITCLASSQAYSLIVSGSRDRTAIIWDLNRLTFVRQLGVRSSSNGTEFVHRGPISAVAINESTGDIATCAISWLHLWSINGELLALVDTFTVAIQQSMIDPAAMGASMSTNLSQLHILSVCFSQHNDWDLDEVILTGASDGSVAFWSMRYYQSPMSEAEIVAAAKKEAGRFVQVSGEKSPTIRDEGTPTAMPREGIEDDSSSLGDDNQKSKNEDEIGRGASSEPIAIANRTARQRTDTMNSEWVKLSTSSASTAETIPILRTTPTTPNDYLSGSEFMESGESFMVDNLLLNSKNESRNNLTHTNKTDQDNQENDLPIVQNLSSTCTLQKRADTESATTHQASDANLPVVTTHESGGDDVEGHNDASLSKANLFLVPNDPSLIKFSKSDTSLVDSFVLLGEASPRQQLHRLASSHHSDSHKSLTPNTEHRRPQSSTDSYENQLSSTPKRPGERPEAKTKSSKLLPNHRWRRQLYLRGVLPRRRGKTLPPAITCLTISKDHRNLYVGDACGKITCWSTN